MQLKRNVSLIPVYERRRYQEWVLRPTAIYVRWVEEVAEQPDRIGPVRTMAAQAPAEMKFARFGIEHDLVKVERDRYPLQLIC
jgi:hypothetical protein